ncbi:hypothetical protein ACN9TI_14680 [Lactococcus lactis]
MIHLNEYGYTQYGKYRPNAGHGVLMKFVDEKSQYYADKIGESLQGAIVE